MNVGEFTPNVAVQDLLDAGLHFGHQTKRWNPKMKRYIFGARNGIYIIDLDKTLDCIKTAMQFLYDTVGRGRSVLFVGTKKQAHEPIKAVAERCKQPIVVNRWLGGTLTNNVTIRKSIARMREIEKFEQDGTMDKLPKKEVSRLRHELEKLRFNLSGIADMQQLPGAVFIFDTMRESIAVAEANRLKIPVVAVVDTNSDPDPVDYPIPANDDAIRAIQLVCNLAAESIEQAQAEFARLAAEDARRKVQEEAAAQARARAEAAVRAATVGDKEARGEKKTARRTKTAEGKAEEKPAEPAAEAGDSPAESKPAG